MSQSTRKRLARIQLWNALSTAASAVRLPALLTAHVDAASEWTQLAVQTDCSLTQDVIWHISTETRLAQAFTVHVDLGSDPRPTSCLLQDLGQLTPPFCSSCIQ